jgi:DNA-binding PadR family transcriptional regulator
MFNVHNSSSVTGISFPARYVIIYISYLIIRHKRMQGYLSKIPQFPIDKYIGMRYSIYIVRRYIGSGGIVMANIALTEAVYYILLSLLTPRHGYGIMQNTEMLSAGRVKLAAGTLYGAINSLLEKGWILALPGEKDSRKKEYVITEDGKAILKAEIQRLKELVENGTRIMEEQV